MATKAQLFVKRLGKEVPAYRHDENLGLYLDEATKTWVGIHVHTGEHLEGPSGRFKKKRACIKFLSFFEDMNWDVSTQEEMFSRNGGFEVVNEIYQRAATEAIKED